MPWAQFIKTFNLDKNDLDSVILFCNPGSDWSGCFGASFSENNRIGSFSSTTWRSQNPYCQCFQQAYTFPSSGQVMVLLHCHRETDEWTTWIKVTIWHLSKSTKTTFNPDWMVRLDYQIWRIRIILFSFENPNSNMSFYLIAEIRSDNFWKTGPRDSCVPSTL